MRTLVNVSLLAFVLVSGCAKPAPPPAKAAPAPVTVARAMVKTVPVQMKVIGRAKSISTVSIRAQLVGQIKEVHFKEGDQISKDQKLFTLDPRLYQAAVRVAAANLVKSKAVLQGAERILNRVERLSGGAVSAEEIEVARTSVDSARAVVAADEAALNSAQVTEAYTTITSPIAGRAGELLVNAGNLVAANDPNPLVVINQISPIFVTFALPEQQLSQVARAQKNHPLKVEAYLRDGSPPVPGELLFIDNTVDITTGTVQLKAEFKNQDSRLWPGQFVDVVLTIQERPDSVVIPVAAVQSGQQGEYVYVVTAARTVELRPVSLAFERNGEAVIATGLQGGESVVVEGQLRLAPGASVEVKDLAANAKSTEKSTPVTATQPTAVPPETVPARRSEK